MRLSAETAEITHARTMPSGSMIHVSGILTHAVPDGAGPGRIEHDLVESVAVVGEELADGLLGVVVDDTDDLCALGPERRLGRGEAHQLGRLLLARVAPGGEEVEHDPRAPPAREVERTAAERAAGDGRRRPAEQRGVGGVVPAARATANTTTRKAATMATATEATSTGRRRGAGATSGSGPSLPAAWSSAIELAAQSGRQGHAGGSLA